MKSITPTNDDIRQKYIFDVKMDITSTAIIYSMIMSASAS
ncbi:hypothetical protein I2400191J7_07320 [Ruminococcus bicirculans (ex Wegman et al. 2014)]